MSKETLYLRDFQERDAYPLALHANNPAVSKNLRDRFPSPYSLKDAESFVALQLSAVKTLNKVVALDDQLIGVTGIIPQEDVYRFSAEIGYWIAEEHWGKGFGKLALNKMVGYAFSNFDINRIYACTYEHNLASMRVLIHSGFRLEGVHRKKIFKRGEFFDEHVFGLLKEEFGM